MDVEAAESLRDFAERSGPLLLGLDRKALFEQLEERYDELLGALGWFVEQGRTDDALRLSSALAFFWTATKRLDEGSAWFDRIFELPGGDDANRGRACAEAGFLAFWKGEDDQATTFFGRALETGRAYGDPTLVARGLAGLARIALRSQDFAETRRLCREALAVTEGTSDLAGRSNAFHVLGVAAQMAGDLLEAREHMAERIRLSRELGSYGGLSMEASNLSMVERQLGNLDRAEELAREALDIFRRREDEWAIPYGLNSLAAVARDRGEHERAATLLGAAEALVEAQGAAWPPDERPHYEQSVATLTEAMGAAEYERVRAAGRSLSSHEAVDYALAAG